MENVVTEVSYLLVLSHVSYFYKSHSLTCMIFFVPFWNRYFYRLKPMVLSSSWRFSPGWFDLGQSGFECRQTETFRLKNHSRLGIWMAPLLSTWISVGPVTYSVNPSSPSRFLKYIISLVTSHRAMNSASFVESVTAFCFSTVWVHSPVWWQIRLLISCPCHLHNLLQQTPVISLQFSYNKWPGFAFSWGNVADV